MLLLAKPSAARIRTFRDSERSRPLSYPERGGSREQAPPAYTTDHNRVRLGSGPEAYAAATLAIRQWKMFDLGWVELCWPDTPIEAGATVAVLVNHFGFWSLNSCRIVYVLKSTPPSSGTVLPTEPCPAMRKSARSASPSKCTRIDPSGTTSTPSRARAASPTSPFP